VRWREALAILALGVAAVSAAGPRSDRKPAPGVLPVLGTRLSGFPEGPGKAIADRACLQCHSADIPRQQRLTEKQWTAEVEKMTRWGAEVSASDKEALVGYLASRFGPGNAGFQAVEVRPSAPASGGRPAARR
jgi:mono/diheme cytochrome c family protein